MCAWGVGLDPIEKSRPIAYRHSRKRYQLNMKRILLSVCAVTLLATTGCLIAEGGHGGGRHGHAHYESYPVVTVAAPVVVVPVVRVRVD
jgi:hypothetical protein